MNRDPEEHRLYMKEYRRSGRDRSVKVQAAAKARLIREFIREQPDDWQRILDETWAELFPDHTKWKHDHNE